MPRKSAAARTRPKSAATPERAVLTSVRPAALSTGEPALPPLAIGIAVSILVHGFVLAINFAPDLKPKQKAVDQALEVVLVNARGKQKPVDPQALAQANLDGGGNTDQDRLAKTPLPASRLDQTGDQLVSTQSRVQELERLQQKLLAEAQARTEVIPIRRWQEQPEPSPQQRDNLSGAERAASALALDRQRAAIARNIDEYNKRPRKKFVGSRTQEYRFAQYVDNWRQKIERIGSQNYPLAARGKVYGNVTLTVEIRQNGEVASISLERSSGHKILDDAAVRIVRKAAPYPKFPEDIERDYDVLSITRTLIFARGDLFESN